MASEDSQFVKATIAALRSQGFRITDARCLMLRAIETAKEPVSAYDLVKLMGKGKAETPTVYRSLALLESRGFVRRHDFGDGIARYVAVIADFTKGVPECSGHYVICRECGKRQFMGLCTVDPMLRHARGLGFSVLSHVAEIFGRCEECTKRLDEEA